MPLQFNWTSFDLTNRLPVAWQDQVIATATSADFRHFPRTPVISREALEQDCSVIRPAAGQLIVFDGRQHPHYARPLRSDSDLRVVAVMNFYTESCPESTRPRELNRHLYGDR